MPLVPSKGGNVNKRAGRQYFVQAAVKEVGGGKKFGWLVADDWQRAPALPDP